ncbi:sulfite exporter TauE/SafE family protein [Clostridium saccharoperbutylacetonicum]|jgi:uncharacterized membrane protein YfcA
MFGFLSILLASFTQGITGFGFALIAVPLLSFFIPELKDITPIIVIYSLLTNIILLYKLRHSIAFKKIILMIIFAMISTPLGTFLLLYINVKILKIMVGIVIFINALAMFNDFKIKIQNEKISYGLVGILSGILNGSVGLSGPPIVLFLTNQNVSKDVFRANLSFFGFITNIFTIILFAFEGIINQSILNFTIIYLPALIIGVLFGIKASSKINELKFRKLTIYLILALGLYTVAVSIIK